MKGFYAGIFAVLGALLLLTWHFRPQEGQVNTFYGIVDTTETVISAELAVELERVPVVSGQIIRPGDTLAVMRSGELEKSIAELRHSLQDARATQAAGQGEIRVKLAELEAQYAFNQRMVSRLRDGETASAAGDREPVGPLQAAITGLRGMLALEQPSLGEMEAYLTLLLREREKLTIVSSEVGVIGTVHHRAGERVQPFRPVLTFYNGSPSTVRGYIHEGVHGRIESGRKVRVRSLASAYDVPGEVVGVGHRILEYPVRLRKRPDIQVWGREVTIRIPPDNAFLLGEKVMIAVDSLSGGREGRESRDSRSLLPGLSAHAASVADGGSPGGEAWDLPGVESSGIVFLADLGKFLVISDDTPDKRPLLHLVEAKGAVERLLEIQGLPAVNDMEAIAQDSKGRLYIATSQSRNKNGKLPATRRLLVRAVREGVSVRRESSVQLLDALENAAREAGDEDWAEWLRGAIRESTLDMEGIAPHGKALLLGFKAPLRNGRAVILRIHDVEGLMAGRPLKPGGLSLWAEPELVGGESGIACGVSDLFFHEGVLHILGTGVAESGSGVVSAGGGGWWTFDPDKGAPRLLRFFSGEKPEGIAYDPVAEVFRIAFDNGGSRPGRILSVRPPSPSP